MVLPLISALLYFLLYLCAGGLVLGVLLLFDIVWRGQRLAAS